MGTETEAEEGSPAIRAVESTGTNELADRSTVPNPH